MNAGKTLFVYTTEVSVDFNDFIHTFRERELSILIKAESGIAGAGEEMCLEGDKEEISRQKERLFSRIIYYGIKSSPVLIGGFTFDQRMHSKLWSKFPTDHFTLHRYTLRRICDRYYLILCSYSSQNISEREMRKEVERISWKKKQSMQRVRIGNSRSVPDLERWSKIIEGAKEFFSEGAISKVVLSRVRLLQVKNLDSIEFYSKLLESYGENMCFYFSIGGEIFLGASPETLVRKRGLSVETEALAGSAPRGNTKEEEDAQKERLLSSDKDRIEHKIVVRSIQNVLKEVCSEVKISKMSVKTLSYIHHLNTILSGKLYPGITIFDLAKQMHPTPALGGFPRKEALNVIKELEVEGRGWYGSPVGWMDAEGDGEFSVAIRSALLKKDEIALFTGAGIVPESDPVKEWEETELKLLPMTKILESV